MRSAMKYFADDNTPFDSEFECRQYEAIRAGYSHTCPQCKGTTKMNGEAITEQVQDKEQMAFMGWNSTPIYMTVIKGHHQVNCNVCSGRGFTKERMVPLTESTIIGYKAAT